MKWFFIPLFIIGLAACIHTTNKKPVESKTPNDRLDPNHNSNPNATEKKSSADFNCNFDIFLNDPNTPKLAKDIYLDNDWSLENDSVLNFLDSLNAKNKPSRSFYFKVVTKSKKNSDGYYSEGLGYAGHKYVLNNTQEFASYFDNKSCYTDADLETWTEIVLMELGLGVEVGYDKPIVDDYIKELKSNCQNCSTEQKETITKFCLILKENWLDFLKHLD